jgi:hypothetical protein
MLQQRRIQQQTKAYTRNIDKNVRKEELRWASTGPDLTGLPTGAFHIVISSLQLTELWNNSLRARIGNLGRVSPRQDSTKHIRVDMHPSRGPRPTSVWQGLSFLILKSLKWFRCMLYFGEDLTWSLYSFLFLFQCPSVCDYTSSLRPGMKCTTNGDGRDTRDRILPHYQNQIWSKAPLLPGEINLHISVANHFENENIPGMH